MVVDDEKDIIMVVKSFLEKGGFEVHTATGGQECLESIEEVGPDILLMDVMMPDMNGWAVLRELKDKGTLEDTKVIMLTVVKEPYESYENLSSHVLDYIRKPFTEEDLLKRVNRISEL